MRLPWALVLGALLGSVQARQIAVRQDNGQTTPSPDNPATTPTPPPGDGGNGGSTAPPPDTTPTDGGGGGSDGGSGGGGDQTVFETKTVTNDVEVITKQSTLTTTILKTSTSTSTVVTTSTTTEHGKDVATKTVVKTSTKYVDPTDQPARRTAPAPAGVYATGTIAAVDAVITSAPIKAENHGYDLVKRDTITKTTTTTVGEGGKTTTFDVTTKAIMSTKVETTKVTSTMVETEQADAKSTTTVTSTYVTTSTKVTTVVTATSTGDGGNSDGSSGDNSNSSNGGDSSGLSTGAKAGIGVGAAVVGLGIIGALLFFCLRRRRESKVDPDDMVGASEVPVGGPGNNAHSPPMSKHSPAAAAFLAPGRSPIKNNATPEGYRGTAMGDGRAGYAKPEPYGSAYTSPATTMTANNRTSPMGADHLPEHSTPMDMNATNAGMAGGMGRNNLHPQTAELGTDSGTATKWHDDNAAEIDSQPVMGHQSGPVPSDVYEMPAQPYR